jgi:hypothetical protein
MHFRKPPADLGITVPDITRRRNGAFLRKVFKILLFDLWIEFYERIDDAGRRRMPVRPIYFLAPQD